MGYEKYSTVGELIDILQKFPRNTKIFSRTNNMEKVGYEDKHYIDTEIKKFNLEKRNTYDAFDGTPYVYTAIVADKNGSIEGIVI